VLNSASGFKGSLTGNADTATKATQDGNGNNIPNTYETKANATAKYSELEGKIANAGGDNVPDYIVAEAERVAKAVQAVRTSKTLVFSAMSDIHIKDGSTVTEHKDSLISLQSGASGLKEIQKRVPLDFLGLLGDYSYMSSSDYTAEQTMRDIMLAKKALNLAKDKEVWCVGNHDWCYGSGVDRMLTEDELYGHIGANSKGVKPYDSIERCYGYLDFDNQKIRVIYLNTNDCKDGIDNGAITKDNYAYMEMISPTQMRWLADVALDFSNKTDAAEWGVVILSHQPIDYGYNWYKSYY
jgi:predicted MPP superfamily phosphohydrolase